MTGLLRHEALVYGSDEEFLSVAEPFVREAGDAGEPLLLAVGGRLQQRLLQQVGPAAGIVSAAPDHYLSVHTALGRAAALAADPRRSGAGVRVLGRTPQAPWPPWLRYEAATNRLLAHLPIRQVCVYDVRATADEILADVESTHPCLTFPAGRSARRRPYEDPVALVNARHGVEGRQLDETPADLDLLNPAPASARTAVTAVAALSGLEDAEIDTLCLCAAAVIANAQRYGRPPVRLRAWTEDDRVTVTIHDAGRGPADVFTGLLPSAGTAPEEHTSLHLIHQCVSDVALYADETGFTVRLLQFRQLEDHRPPPAAMNSRRG